jgi:transposase
MGVLSAPSADSTLNPMVRKAPKTPRKPPKPSATHRGPAARLEALQLLGEGLTLEEIAQRLGVDRGTVRTWRDHPDGQAYLAKLRLEREARYAAVAEDAKRYLREIATKAVSVLAERLDSTVPFEAVSAAGQILDRVGVLRGAEVQVVSRFDLSRLTEEELDVLERVNKRLDGEGSSGGPGPGADPTPGVQ